ncbi:conserved hypothetical protein [Aspergillus terreus NIH2624]|uniref:FF domain-containing protein n=1 Tax=Aspergillus terreus (strain NIH 2624 / FGSC A1156) TaxID=341663 RepID=Q0CI28_ASPTN|nr:uncharacterized protein ATEG_06656 [Aspergillus terreus NIH2624]EAU33200.1 conserved hypothetical protein [Aspergillus terreus NIH2624]
MRRQSNPHTPDLKRLLQNPNRPPKSHILSQTPFRRFPRLPTPLMGSELAPLRMGLRIMDNLEGAFAAEKAIMTAKVGVRKIARKPSILFPGTSEQEGHRPDEEEESDEYEEVEVTDSEDGDHPSKRPRTEGEDQEGPVEFTEEDIEYQLAAMGEEYGLDPGEYGEPGEGEWEEGAEGLPLTDEDASALFHDLLDDYHINPYSTWEKIIEEGRIIEDSRYTALPNMKARREVWSQWSRDRIQKLKERKEKQEKKDPRIKYLAFLQDHATPKLYWPEFKRKYRKEPEMRDSQLSDKDREKYYRELVSRLKTPESTRKSDLSALLKSIPLHELNRSSSLEALPTSLITDLRYIALTPKIRDPLIETYISTLPPAPEQENLTPEQREEMERKRVEREKREKALAEREKQVQENKRKQRSDLLRGRSLLKEGEAEIEEALRVGKAGLRSHIEAEGATQTGDEKDGES